MNYTSPQRSILTEADNKIRKLEREYQRSGDPDLKRKLDRLRKRYGLTTYEIQNLPSTMYKLVKSGWDGVIGAIPVVTNIPQEALEHAKEITRGMNGNQCPYGHSWYSVWISLGTSLPTKNNVNCDLCLMHILLELFRHGFKRGDLDWEDLDFNGPFAWQDLAKQYG